MNNYPVRLFFLWILCQITFVALTGQSLESRLDSLGARIPADLAAADSLGVVLLEEIQADNRSDLYARIYASLGLIQYYSGKYQLSSKYYEEALTHIDPELQAELEASIWNNLGINYELSENATAAVAAYLKSLDYALAQADSVSIYQSYLNLGLMYAKVSDLEQSEQCLDPNLKLSDVAYALGTNEKYVSQAMWISGKTRFNTFINFYRINKAKTLLRSGDLSQLSIGEVAKKIRLQPPCHFPALSHAQSDRG